MNTSKPANKPARPSRKARIKALFLERGPEEAAVYARRLKIADSSYRTWARVWAREAAAEKTAKVRARTEKKRVTKAKAMQEATAESAMPETSTVEPRPAPVE